MEGLLAIVVLLFMALGVMTGGAIGYHLAGGVVDPHFFQVMAAAWGCWSPLAAITALFAWMDS